MRPIGIAGLQLQLGKGDNGDRIAAEIAAVKARLPWVDMVVLGELSVFGASIANAQPLPGEAEAKMCAAARAAGVWLVPGSLFEADGGRVYNTAPVIDPTGQVVARYRKIKPNADARLFLKDASAEDANKEEIVFEEDEAEVNVDAI